MLSYVYGSITDRLVLSFIFNVVTACSCFIIAREVYFWRAATPDKDFWGDVCALFIFFIFSIGVAHLGTLVLLISLPWWYILIITVPKMALSVVMAATLMYIRPRVLQLLARTRRDEYKELTGGL